MYTWFTWGVSTIQFDTVFCDQYFRYWMKHKVHVYNHDLPIAKSNFSYRLTFMPRNGYKCNFDFQWLPCGESFDCKNTRPGSNYSFQFKWIIYWYSNFITGFKDEWIIIISLFLGRSWKIKPMDKIMGTWTDYFITWIWCSKLPLNHLLKEIFRSQ